MRFSRVLVSSLTIITLLSGCTKKGSGLDYGLDVKETLRVNLLSEPPSLDWSKSTDTTSSMVEMNIMEGLVEYDLKDPNLGLIPALATEWKPSDGAKTWTFTIRKGVKWTDGVELTAQHFVDGFERLLNPTTASEYAYFIFDIKGARDYNAGKIKDMKQVGARVNEQGQLVIELDRPMGHFPMLTTHHSMFPLRKDVIEKHGEKWTEPENIVTLGAYKLKIWEHDKSIVLERNEDYYGEKAKTRYVLGYMINEYSTALSLVDAGKIDFQRELPAKELSQLKQKPGYREFPVIQMYYYGMNTKKKPFDNVKVRKAFAHAIDRKQITDLMNAGHSPLHAWVPKGMASYEEGLGIKFDVERAQKLMDEAGYKDRSKVPKITIAFNTNENHQRIAENVQAQLKKNLGVVVEIANQEWKVYLATLRTDAPSIYRMGWLGDYPDPSTFMNLMTSFSENNHTGWGSKTYDDLVAQGISSLDLDQRKQIYAKAQKILVEDEVPVIPIYSAVQHVMLSERTKNFPVPNGIERWLFKGVTLE